MRWTNNLRGFLPGFAVGIAVMWALKSDMASVVDAFYEQQVENKVNAVFQRRAADVSYEQCRQNAASCLGKTVVWPVSHPAAGDSRYAGDSSRPIQWSNEKQVPISLVRSDPFPAIAAVKAVHPGSIELVFLGSAAAVYGGTTWTKKFGFGAAASSR